MSTLNYRLSKVERRMGSQPCLACAQTPRCFVISDAATKRQFDHRMREHAAGCTCNQTLTLKRITMVSSGE
jgi:hypothetical protein